MCIVYKVKYTHFTYGQVLVEAKSEVLAPLEAGEQRMSPAHPKIALKAGEQSGFPSSLLYGRKYLDVHVCSMGMYMTCYKGEEEGGQVTTLLNIWTLRQQEDTEGPVV